MARKRYSTESGDEDYDLTPMIDIVFLLIAFFMVVAKMIDDTKIDIKIPIADQSMIPEKSPHRVTISIPAGGEEVYWGPQKMGDPTEITPLVKSYYEAKGDLLEVYVRADANTPHRAVRDVMKAVAEAGVFNVKFAAFENK